MSSYLAQSCNLKCIHPHLFNLYLAHMLSYVDFQDDGLKHWRRHVGIIRCVMLHLLAVQFICISLSQKGLYEL